MKTPYGSKRGELANSRSVLATSVLIAACYDLSQDIGETNNVAGEHPEVIQRIERYLKTARTVSRSYPREVPSWGYHRLETGYVK